MVTAGYRARGRQPIIAMCVDDAHTSAEWGRKRDFRQSLLRGTGQDALPLRSQRRVMADDGQSEREAAFDETKSVMQTWGQVAVAY
jgi:hypothetical protein